MMYRMTYIINNTTYQRIRAKTFHIISLEIAKGQDCLYFEREQLGLPGSHTKVRVIRQLQNYPIKRPAREYNGFEQTWVRAI